MPQARPIRVIGIDCATEHAKVGIAADMYSDRAFTVTDVALCSKDRDAASIAAEWLLDCKAAVVGIDAPLGWPKPLADNLITHAAGNPLNADAHSMFRRETASRPLADPKNTARCRCGSDCPNCSLRAGDAFNAKAANRASHSARLGDQRRMLVGN